MGWKAMTLQAGGQSRSCQADLECGVHRENTDVEREGGSFDNSAESNCLRLEVEWNCKCPQGLFRLASSQPLRLGYGDR